MHAGPGEDGRCFSGRKREDWYGPWLFGLSPDVARIGWVCVITQDSGVMILFAWAHQPDLHLCQYDFQIPPVRKLPHRAGELKRLACESSSSSSSSSKSKLPVSPRS